jgi:hypothetical protein
MHLGVDWDLASMVQKKEESLWEFIQCFCNKRNIIPKVDDKSIIMFINQGLILDPQAHHEEPSMSEEMVAITNKYALTEEVTLDTRE